MRLTAIVPIHRRGLQQVLSVQATKMSFEALYVLRRVVPMYEALPGNEISVTNRLSFKSLVSP